MSALPPPVPRLFSLETLVAHSARPGGPAFADQVACAGEGPSAAVCAADLWAVASGARRAGTSGWTTPGPAPLPAVLAAVRDAYLPLGDDRIVEDRWVPASTGPYFLLGATRVPAFLAKNLPAAARADLEFVAAGLRVLGCAEAATAVAAAAAVTTAPAPAPLAMATAASLAFLYAVEGSTSLVALNEAMDRVLGTHIRSKVVDGKRWYAAGDFCALLGDRIGAENRNYGNNEFHKLKKELKVRQVLAGILGGVRLGFVLSDGRARKYRSRGGTGGRIFRPLWAERTEIPDRSSDAAPPSLSPRRSSTLASRMPPATSTKRRRWSISGASSSSSAA